MYTLFINIWVCSVISYEPCRCSLPWLGHKPYWLNSGNWICILHHDLFIIWKVMSVGILQMAKYLNFVIQRLGWLERILAGQLYMLITDQFVCFWEKALLSGSKTSVKSILTKWKLSTKLIAVISIYSFHLSPSILCTTQEVLIHNHVWVIETSQYQETENSDEVWFWKWYSNLS